MSIDTRGPNAFRCSRLRKNRAPPGPEAVSPPENNFRLVSAARRRPSLRRRRRPPRRHFSEKCCGRSVFITRFTVQEKAGRLRGFTHFPQSFARRYVNAGTEQKIPSLCGEMRRNLPPNSPLTRRTFCVIIISNMVLKTISRGELYDVEYC